MCSLSLLTSAALVFSLYEGPSLSLVVLLLILIVNLIVSSVKSCSSSSLLSSLITLTLLTTTIFTTTFTLLIFYITYEFSLLPMLILISLFGYQPEKLTSCLYLLIYTVLCSVPLFLFVITTPGCLFYSFTICGSTTVLLLALAFLVKAPLFGVHI